MGVGAIIFNFLGASIRWLYGTFWRTIANKRKFTFKEYLYGSEKPSDWFELTGHTFVNKIIGAIILVLICLIIIKLGF